MPPRHRPTPEDIPPILPGQPGITTPEQVFFRVDLPEDPDTLAYDHPFAPWEPFQDAESFDVDIAAFLHPEMFQPDGTVLYELIVMHALAHPAHRPVRMLDILVDLKDKSTTWERLQLRPWPGMVDVLMELATAGDVEVTRNRRTRPVPPRPPAPKRSKAEERAEERRLVRRILAQFPPTRPRHG